VVVVVQGMDTVAVAVVVAGLQATGMENDRLLETSAGVELKG
jgi:hypothetical protein